MANDEFDIRELKIKERPKPPAFGLWLSLLAIGLTLAAIRPIALISSLSILPSAGALAQLAMSAWAVVNLVLLLKRRRVFVKSMIAYLVVNAVLLLVLSTITVMPRLSLPLSLVGIAVGVLWVLYLLRSQHVRLVFVR